MKKITSLILVIVLAVSAFALTSCQKDINKKSEGVMTWEQYNAAALDAPVVVEAYVQAKQEWWQNKITLFAADVDGGYFVYEMECSEEDNAKVYEEFLRVADKKNVGAKELDAIVASVALQVPATYKLQSYVINNGNIITASAQVTLTKGDKQMQGISNGDGPIDAAFVAIESITGCHYELDDFQLQAVTEGREAMGQTIVKLRSGGKVYSGRGISTDIVGAGIGAYLSALNKIIYEEEVE